MGSTRFRGKMMEPLGEHSLLEWVLSRVQRSTRVAQVVLATSLSAENGVLCELAERLLVSTTRGSENDVLGRFVQAAGEHGADHVVRICADNPFISPEEIDRLVCFYLDRMPDYSFNHIPRMGNEYPDGLGAEIFSYSQLCRLAELTSEPRYREHVTAYFGDHEKEFRIETFVAPPGIDFPRVKLDVDTREDLDRLRALVPPISIHSSAFDVINTYRAVYG